MFNSKYKTAVTGLLIVSLWGCDHNLDVTPNTPTLTVNPNNQDALANYYFNWETAPQMPKSSLSGALDIGMPWSSQQGAAVNPGIKNDYKKIDGWELVYNNFVPDNYPYAGNRGTMGTENPLFFALYNRYRGIIRYYYYVPSNSGSNQYSHGLELYSSGNSVKSLNFEGNDIVDANNNNRSFLQTSTDGIQSSGGWYAMQYEIAYDPNINNNTTFPNPGFMWKLRAINVTDIKLDGQETSSIKGTAVKSNPPSGFDWIGTTLGVMDIASNVVGTFAGGLAKKVADIVQGVSSGSTKDFLSGTFGQTSSGDQTIDLTLSGTIVTTGTATSNVPFTSTDFVFPSQNPGSGQAPLYNNSIGVFNLSGRPQVALAVYTYPVSSGGGGGGGFGGGGGGLFDPVEYNYYYTVDPAAVRNLVQLNPNVFNSDPNTGADLNNFKAEVVAIDPYLDYVSAGSNTREDIGGGRIAYTGTPYVRFAYESTDPNIGNEPNVNTIAVRVSFYVHPYNSAAKDVYIVKTFLADVIQ